ncbi:Alpha/Beta hydrolase protein [Suillus subaureus]|uniref:Dipeptidyl-peptidase V n=1 Tax=Suillus subaureus TaxID=48587 RepID=A0A9P7EIH5_9AGAM|nr:Alpha/Beta hydrolase protein [Suillus subaureus]KAG1822832.1 Alpha/Beta hydrolase protein [Suillus subaureus]
MVSRGARICVMRILPFLQLGFAAQVPLYYSSISPASAPQIPQMATDFTLSEGANALSPQDMLTLPRPGVPLPNDIGDLAIVPISTYSFQDRKSHKSLSVIALSDGRTYDIPLPDGGDAFWLDSRTIAHVVTKDDTQSLYTIPISTSPLSSDLSSHVGSFPITTASAFRYSSSAQRLVFSAYVYPDGLVETVREQDTAYENRGNSGLVYDEMFERQWDTWVGPKSKALIGVSLAKVGAKWVLGETYVNVLKGTGLSSPVEPFGETDDYDISKTHAIFTAKDPQLPRAVHTRQNIYLVAHDGKDLRQLTSGVQGATHSPVFSPSGDKVAWLELALDGHESDRAKVVIYDLKENVRFTITEDWDRSPDSIVFSPSSTLIYATTGDHARIKIFGLAVPPTPPSNATITTRPTALTSSGSISGFTPIPGGRATFALSSLTSPNEVYELSGLDATERDLLAGRKADVKATTVTRLTSFSSAGLQGKDLSPGKDFWFKGTAEGQDTHGYVITPPGFERGINGKWPAVLLIHGGPESAWFDQWSTRWNPNVFASQGYVVVAINPTGSTSFGQKFTDGINKNWGGRPIQDLLMGWKYILREYPEIDQNRTVAAGASYGGYAIKRLDPGNPELGFGFKALVCHDGVFDIAFNGYATDELFFFNHEWGGRPWDPAAIEASRKYSPAYTVAKWSTPQLTIHGSKDYRLPESDGIGVFHALQQLGVPSRLLIFPDENHWVLNAGNRYVCSSTRWS